MRLRRSPCASRMRSSDRPSIVAAAACVALLASRDARQVELYNREEVDEASQGKDDAAGGDEGPDGLIYALGVVRVSSLATNDHTCKRRQHTGERAPDFTSDATCRTPAGLRRRRMRKSLSRSSSSFSEAPKRRSVLGKLFSKKDELKQAFKKVAGVAKSDEGTLDADGVKQAISLIGVSRLRSTSSRRMKEHDGDGDGRLTLDEFRAFVSKLTGGQSSFKRAHRCPTSHCKSSGSSRRRSRSRARRRPQLPTLPLLPRPPPTPPPPRSTRQRTTTLRITPRRRSRRRRRCRRRRPRHAARPSSRRPKRAWRRRAVTRRRSPPTPPRTPRPPPQPPRRAAVRTTRQRCRADGRR